MCAVTFSIWSRSSPWRQKPVSVNSKRWTPQSSSTTILSPKLQFFSFKGCPPQASPKRTRHPALLVPYCRCPSFWLHEDPDRASQEHAPRRPSALRDHALVTTFLQMRHPRVLNTVTGHESRTVGTFSSCLQSELGFNPLVTLQSDPQEVRILWPVDLGKWPNAAGKCLPHSHLIFKDPGKWPSGTTLSPRGALESSISTSAWAWAVWLIRPLPPSHHA